MQSTVSENPQERTALVRDMALYIVALRTARRGEESTHVMASNAIRLPDNMGVVMNFLSLKRCDRNPGMFAMWHQTELVPWQRWKSTLRSCDDVAGVGVRS